MKMRERKVALQARQLMGLRMADLLAQLDEAADLLIEALESGDLDVDDQEKRTEPGTPATSGKGES